MARQWRDPGTFRADPAAITAARPTRRQAIALLTALVVVTGVVAAVSYLIRPERARAFHLFGGSLFLADSVAPVAVDLATASPSIRLIDATAEVGATPQQSMNLAVTPLAPGGGTLLLNRATGEFNMVDSTGFVVKHDGGVPLPAQPNSTAVGIPADQSSAPDLTYIAQTGAAGTRVYLVSQATVREAAAVRHVKPRASIALPSPVDTGAAAHTGANGSLWLLTGTGRTHTVRQLSLPARSTADGATLRSIDRGTVSGAAAVASATLPGGRRSAVGVASDDRVEVFAPGQPSRTVPYPAVPGLDSVLPVSNESGQLAYLLHGRTGWNLLSIGTDGTHLQGPTRITDLAADAALVPPAAGGNDLYTLDTNTGGIVRIGADAAATRLPGIGQYPRAVGADDQPIEPGGFGDTYVIGRGTRVFYDSPSHREALAVFTDSDHSPVVIAKSAAVGINAAGDAAALSRSRNRLPPPGKASQQAAQPRARPIAPTIDNSVDCRNTTQKPHIPSIVGVSAASRSVTLNWLYPRIDNQDCLPQTYVVTATLLSGNAPAAPGSVTVQNQTSVTLDGLYPASTYQLTVTAYLGTLSTSSAPVRVETSPQGPPAPSGIRVRADAAGNWVLSWSSCGSVAQGCVPSTSWQIQPHVCDGKSYAGSLDPLTVPADPTTRRQPPAVYSGSSGLLGRGLSFQVMGRGQDNLPGTLSAPTPCVYSWSPPIPSEMKLTASTPQQTAYDTTTNATVALDLGNDPVRAVGGVGAQVTFTLTGNGTTQTKGPITVDGSSGTVSAVFSGVEPGASYRASAAVQPAHSGAPVTLNAPAVSTRSEWPNFSVIPTCAQSLLSCDVDVHIGGISSAATHGELFSLTNSWVQCGTAQEQLHQSDFDPAQSDVTAKLYQIAGFYNSCTVQIQLVEDAPSGAVPVFGGVPSPTETGTVNLGPPAHAAVGHDDFQVAWSTGASSVDINYTGSSDLGQLTDNWSETVQPPVGVQQCGSGQQQPDVTVSVPQDCVDLYGGLSGDWTVTLNFNNVSDGSAGGPFTYQLSGPPPGYQACDPTDLAAAWGATQADGIAVTVDGNADISGCSGWTYTLYDTTTDPPTQICPVSTTADGNAPPATIDTTLCGIPPADGWSLHVAWTDTAGNPQSADFPLGPPPAS